MPTDEFEYYEQTSAAQFMHNLPRFGHSSEFSKLASSNQDEQTDYVVGIFAVSFFILSLFIFWGAAIMTCKCMGKKRVGLCAGRARVVADDKGQFRPPIHLWTLRCSFMVLGCCMILLGVTLVGPGLSSVSSTSVSIRKLNRDVKDLLTQGLLIMDSVKRVRWNIDALDIDEILHVDKACPNLENNTFVSNERMRSSIRSLERDFNHLKEYLKGSDFEGIRQHVDHIMDGTEYVDVAVSVVDRNDWTVRMFALVLNVLVLFMIFAGCSALSGRRYYLPALRWMSELFILPIFLVLIVVGWFATSALAIASISNADFCAGNSQQSGPAGTVMDVFEERGITNDDIILTTFSYYQSGCATEDPIKGLYKYEDDIQGGIGSANEFLVQADEIGIDEINDQCGANARPIIEGIGLIKDNLGILLSALRSTFELASCSKMSPIYRQIFEGTACTQSSGSFTLMFSIMFGINIVGMLMIMLRAAMYPYKKIYASSSLDDEEDEWEEYQAYLGYMASFVTMWGGAANEDGSKTGTATESTVNDTRPNTPISIPSDEEDPRPPHTPARDEQSSRADSDAYFSAQSDEFCENEELIPLSPEPELSTSSIANTSHSRTYTPLTKQQTDCGDENKFVPDGYVVGRVGESESASGSSPRKRRQQHRGNKIDHNSPMELAVTVTNKTEDSMDDYDERKPLSPKTPNISLSGSRSRLTPDFLTSGLPRTPLMTSPNGRHDGVNYFGNVISPLRTNLRKDGPPKRELMSL